MKRSINGYDGYFITELGDIFKPDGTVLRKNYCNSGSPIVNIKNNCGKFVTKTVLSLLVSSFYNAELSDVTVSFLDGDNSNVCVDNIVVSGSRINVSVPVSVYKFMLKNGLDMGLLKITKNER